MINTFFVHLSLPITLLIASISQIVPGLYVLSPSEGQVVQGTVAIKGSVPDSSFDHAEISYSFSDENASNWFLIESLDQPIHDDTLAKWDTTTITDGVYRLKVTVYRKDGKTNDLIVGDIKVGNYTHYDLTTPTVPITQETGQSIQPTATQTPVLAPLPTSLPKNPASIDQSDLQLSLSSGLILAVLVLAVLGVYAFFRRKARK
jgi:hypothetical protein